MLYEHPSLEVWQAVPSLSLLQLDAADRAVLRVAGKKGVSTEKLDDKLYYVMLCYAMVCNGCLLVTNNNFRSILNTA